MECEHTYDEYMLEQKKFPAYDIVQFWKFP